MDLSRDRNPPMGGKLGPLYVISMCLAAHAQPIDLVLKVLIFVFNELEVEGLHMSSQAHRDDILIVVYLATNLKTNYTIIFRLQLHSLPKRSHGTSYVTNKISFKTYLSKTLAMVLYENAWALTRLKLHSWPKRLRNWRHFVLTGHPMWPMYKISIKMYLSKTLAMVLYQKIWTCTFLCSTE